jgi:hypothetical protein
MRRIIALPFTVAVLLALATAPAAAGPATTETVVAKDVVETFPTTDPCSGAPGDVTTTSNSVFHTTVKDGTMHVTFTQTGTFTFTPAGPGPSATGHFAIWGGFNENNQNVAGTFTFNVVGTRSDGSRISAHAVDHMNTTPAGTAYFFSKFHC